MGCLLWVYGLVFVGLWFGFRGFMVCLLWVYGLPFVGLWSTFCGFMVWFLRVYGLPFVLELTKAPETLRRLLSAYHPSTLGHPIHLSPDQLENAIGHSQICAGFLCGSFV